MEVILKSDVPKLGNAGDVVKVAEGYGRNFLLPKKLAIEANAQNKAVIKQMKDASVRRAAKERGSAEEFAKQFAGVTLKFTRKAGEGDHLFGSVTSADVAQELEQRGLKVERRRIELEHPIKTIGEFDVPIRLHRDVNASVKVVVSKDAEAEHAAAPAAAPAETTEA
jgi:large subunit ribosomal protein L9